MTTSGNFYVLPSWPSAYCALCGRFCFKHCYSSFAGVRKNRIRGIHGENKCQLEAKFQHFRQILENHPVWRCAGTHNFRTHSNKLGINLVFLCFFGCVRETLRSIHFRSKYFTVVKKEGSRIEFAMLLKALVQVCLLHFFICFCYFFFLFPVKCSWWQWCLYTARHWDPYRIVWSVFVLYRDRYQQIGPCIHFVGLSVRHCERIIKVKLRCSMHHACTVHVGQSCGKVINMLKPLHIQTH